MRRLRVIQIHTAFPGYAWIATIFIVSVIDHNKVEMHLNRDSMLSVCKRVKACVSFWRLHNEHLGLRLLMRWNEAKSGVVRNFLLFPFCFSCKKTFQLTTLFYFLF